MTQIIHDFGPHGTLKFCRRTACLMAAAIADRYPCRGDKPEPPVAPTTIDLADAAELAAATEPASSVAWTTDAAEGAAQAADDAAELVERSDELAALIGLHIGNDTDDAAAQWLAAYLLGEAEITGRRAPHLVRAIEFELRAAGWHEGYPLRQFTGRE